MTQTEAVIETMRSNGGYATLGYLYAHTLDLQGPVWGTKTPFASIRRIVQKSEAFIKIKAGLWALSEMKQQIPGEILTGLRAGSVNEHSHAYYQGLLLEIGNLEGLGTFIPRQDANKKYLSKALDEVATVHTMYDFSYDTIVRRAQTIDVIWFNSHRLPNSFFEIEHTTDIQNSLLKFLDLQDFSAKMKIVADERRRREFQQKLGYSAFAPIAERVRFASYEDISKLHTRAYELSLSKHILE